MSRAFLKLWPWPMCKRRSYAPGKPDPGKTSRPLFPDLIRGELMLQARKAVWARETNKVYVSICCHELVVFRD